MITLRFLIVGLLALATARLAQAQTSPVIAEAITPEIQALADGLEDDPVQIFNYVHDHIRHVLYFGSKKGAALTLLEKSGNDFDQCALLVALLRAAGQTNIGYQFGWMKLPYESADHQDLRHWLQLSLTNTNWNTTSNYLSFLFQNYRHYPTNGTAAIWGANTFGFQRVWVTLTNGATVYYLDPAFKVSEPISGLDLATATGFSSNTLMSVAGGTYNSDYVFGLNEAAVRSNLTSCTTSLLSYIQGNYPNASVEQILGGWQIVPSTNTALSQSLPFATDEWGGRMPVLNWANQPTNLMATLTLTFNGTNWQQWYLPQLQGQRLALTFDSSGVAKLWQEDTTLAQVQAIYEPSPIDFAVDLRHGSWDTNSNVFVDSSSGDNINTRHFESYGSTNIIIYGYEPDWGWLQQRQEKLDAYRQQGLADNSFPVVSETMNVMGLTLLLESWAVDQIIAAQMGVLPQAFYRFGRLNQEDGNGYYFDQFMTYAGPAPTTGADTADRARVYRFTDAASYFESAAEHAVIEQLQSGNLLGASTVKMLEVASTNGQAVFLANSGNWSWVRSYLDQNYYDSYEIYLLDDFISLGHTLLLPRYWNWVGNGDWAGYGLMDWVRAGTSSTYIQGGYFGGQVSQSGATANPLYVAGVGQGQSQRNPYLDDATHGDPVAMETGAFQMNLADLSLGGPEPRGITVSRHYASRGRAYNPSGMGPGWVNNYHATAKTMTAATASLGRTTPAQMAPILAATCAAIGIYNDASPQPKNWMVTALISKWAFDQLNKTGVSVQLGRDTVQFIQQPDGSFTPPARCTMTLTQNGSAYSLQQRHGNTFNFDSLGRLASVVDQYSQSLTVAYLSSTSLLPQRVTDWKSRWVQFNYNGGTLTDLADSAGRAVSYGYNAQGDLTAVTDPEGKTWSYNYDTNHQIVGTFDADNRLIVSNAYDGFGRVVTQYTEGDTNKMWQVFWSGWQTVAQDPAGGKTRYFYDDRTRLTGVQDPLGNLSRTAFDGQDHVVMTVSPLNETNRFEFDGRHNLLLTIDPLNFTNRFSYDGQDRLTTSVDPRGNANGFGYNAQHSLTGSTNGAGDWVTFNYNSDGTLYTSADSGGTTTYGQDSYGQLNNVTYPGSLGSESFVNSALGDRTSHTDARGFIRTLQYNNRRELTNAVAPTNLTVRITYSPAGNVVTTTDARGHTTSNTWSATSKLLAVTLPSTPQGTPVITSLYDKRDWLAKTTDPLQHATLYTNDIARRLISATDPLLRTTGLGYDNDGRQVASTNAANEVTRQEWSARGELVKTITPQLSTISRGFDAAGNQITLTNRNGKKWQFQFDGANRLTNTITPLNRQSARTFNNRGLLASVKHPSGNTATLTYDPKNRLTNHTDNVGTILYGYDANNNRTNVSEAGWANSWTFDAYDRVSSYRDADGNLIQYRMDANGNLTNLTYPGGRTVSYSFDSLNRLTNVTDWANRRTSIEYDLASRVKKITRPNGTVRQINYDAAGEPTNIVEKTTTGFPIAFFTLGWTNSGRVAWEFAGPLPHSYTPPARTMTFDDDNRLATFNGNNVTHDTDGNMTYGPGTNDTLLSYGFDARNRLLNVAGVDYGYDPAGNRASVSNATGVARFVINPGPLSQVLMRVRSGVTNYYIYGVGLCYEITETATSTNTATYHFDLRGSTVALTDGNGLPTDRIEYSAYGSITYRAGNTDTPFLFNGMYGVQTDSNGLLYMRARYYNPYIGRFINADPIGFAGGLNFYAYANGDPVSLMDPFGLSAWSAAGGFAKGVGNAIAGLWDAINPNGHAAQTTDALFDIPLHPIQTVQNLARGIENTFANFGAGFGSGNFEKAGEAGFGIAMMLLPELRLGKVAEVGQAGRVLEGAEKTVDLYRAVGVREFNDVMARKVFQAAQDSMTSRQFGLTLEEALKFADGDPTKVAILKATVPESLLPELHFSKSIDPHIFKSGVITVYPEMQPLFNQSLKAVEHVY